MTVAIPTSSNTRSVETRMLCPGPPWRRLAMTNHGWSEQIGAIRMCEVAASEYTLTTSREWLRTSKILDIPLRLMVIPETRSVRMRRI
jgi:hypothetical protein